VSVEDERPRRQRKLSRIWLIRLRTLPSMMSSPNSVMSPPTMLGSMMTPYVHVGTGRGGDRLRQPLLLIVGELDGRSHPGDSPIAGGGTLLDHGVDDRG
jgi:hypothetical protein